MATRPIFLPLDSPLVGARECLIEFDWFPGMSATQKQKSIRSLHVAAEMIKVFPILEISSKSEEELGVALSAFNLSVTTKVNKSKFTVETAFQGSKVFEKGGPYKDLLGLDSRTAKKDVRLKSSGNVIGFRFFGRDFPNKPRTFFYDWLYINALAQNQELANAVTTYSAFSDIEFNPTKSISCQARSAALFVSLVINEKLSDALVSPDSFLRVLDEHYINQGTDYQVQMSAF